MNLKLKIGNLICATALLCLLVSCHSDDNPFGGRPTDRFDIRPFVSLHISPLSMATRAVQTAPEEKIKTLRIVLLTETNGQNYIELNKYIDFTAGEDYQGPGEAAATMNYVFARVSCPGKKKFYVIANEEYVTPLQYEMPEGVPAPEICSQTDNLQTLLNYYSANYIPGYSIPGFANSGYEEDTPAGDEFELVINSIHYIPDYTPTDGELYLPYTVFYGGYEIAEDASFLAGAETGTRMSNSRAEGDNVDGDDDDEDENQGGDNQNDGDEDGEDNQGDDKPESEEPDNIGSTPPDYFVEARLWLVPVATKFNFEFYNYRQNPVQLATFNITGIAQDNFLLGQVLSQDYNKYVGENTYYWVDWLAQVSDASGNYFPDISDNENFNKLWGWITNYNVPTTAYSQDNASGLINILDYPMLNLITGEEMGDGNIIPGYGEDNENPGPGSVKFGPIYFPESHYFNSNNTEAYNIALRFEGTLEQEESYDFAEQLGNVRSLFRNTSVLVQVTMNDWDNVGAFVQIQTWTHSSQNGYLTEDQD